MLHSMLYSKRLQKLQHLQQKKNCNFLFFKLILHIISLEPQARPQAIYYIYYIENKCQKPHKYEKDKYNFK